MGDQSLPSVLNYITQEFRRFERERAVWDSERGQLKSRLALVEAEKDAALKSVDDLKRRVVMLQYALRQERAKSGSGVPASPSRSGAAGPAAAAGVASTPDGSSKVGRVKADTVRIPSLAELEASSPVAKSAGSSISITERSRSLLRSYLQEMGLQDTVVRAPVTPVAHSTEPAPATAPATTPAATATATATATEPAAAAGGFNMDALADVAQGTAPRKTSKRSKLAEQMAAYKADEAATVAAAKEAIAAAKGSGRKTAAAEPAAAGEDDLGSLAELSAEDTQDGTRGSSKSDVPVWKQKFVLRNHMDEVRALAFHATDPALVTGSEDCTVKLWNIDALESGSRRSSPDHEPVFTFRGHRGPVYSVAVASSANVVFSGSADGHVRAWKMPSLASSPYESHGSASAYKLDILDAHTDSVWGVAVHDDRALAGSVSADGTVKLWDVAATFSAQPRMNGGSGMTGTRPAWSHSASSVPTALDFVAAAPNAVAVAYRDSTVALHDLETGKITSSTVIGDGPGGVTSQPNALVAHPTLPWIVTVHENKRLVFVDVNTNEIIDSVIAHPSAVSSVAIHPSGLYIMTGGADSSVRFWDVSTRKCVQALTKHMQKHEASIQSVAYHPALPWCATGGADANVRLYA